MALDKTFFSPCKQYGEGKTFQNLKEEVSSEGVSQHQDA